MQRRRRRRGGPRAVGRAGAPRARRAAGADRPRRSRHAATRSAGWRWTASRRSWTSWSATDDVRLVAITGAGRTFCSGAAIREFDAIEDGGTLLTDRGTRLLDRVEDLPMPTVALVNGHAVGGGAEVALACDWRIIAPDAELRFVHASIGLVPGFGGLGRLRATSRRGDGAAAARDVRVGGRPARRRSRPGGRGDSGRGAARTGPPPRAARRRIRPARRHGRQEGARRRHPRRGARGVPRLLAEPADPAERPRLTG